MKKLNYVSTFSMVLGLSLLSATALASNAGQISCRNVYAPEAAAKPMQYPNVDSFRTQRDKDLRTQIDKLDKDAQHISDDLSSLKAKIESGTVEIPYDIKPDKLSSLERKLRWATEDDESDQKSIRELKEKISKSDDDEVEHYRSGGGYGLFGFMRDDGPKHYSKNEVDRMKERITELEKRIAKRQREDIIPLTKEVQEARAPFLGRAISKAQVKVKELEGQLAKAQATRDTVKAQIAESDRAVRAKVTAATQEALKDPRLVSPLTDLMGFYSLENIPKTNKVTLMIGSDLNGANHVDTATLSEVRQLVSYLVSRKYYVVFDGNSPYGPQILSFAGEYGIPVTAKEDSRYSSNKNHVVISNDFLRMNTLASAAATVGTPDSVAATGLYVEGLLGYVLDVKESFSKNGYSNWAADLKNRDRNLGVSAKSAKVAQNTEGLVREFQATGSSTTPSVSAPVARFKSFLRFTPEVLSGDFLIRILGDSISYAKVMDQNANTGGSVVFGSSKTDSTSVPLIYESSYKLGRLGIPVATGGSGGAMKIANSGAYNAGGVSIGIPIGGKHTLDSEKSYSTAVHSKTIVAAGYEERIPALLGDGDDSRQLIIFAPGGDGTIKELATTLVRSADKLNSFSKLIFLDSNYYQGLYDWLQNSSLPQELKKKMVLVDKADQVEEIAKTVQTNQDRSRIASPRKDEPTYKKSDSFYSGGFGGFGGGSSKWHSSDDWD